MSVMHCPLCDSTNLTQDGVPARLVALGYYLCLDCTAELGRNVYVKPLIQPLRVTQEES